MVQEKALVLRSIKELEFDRAMGKISEEDFAEIGGRLRERAMVLMEDLEGAESRKSEVRSPESAAVHGAGPETRGPKADVRGRRATCSSCGTESEPDARFCRECGAKL
jgi:hypothetical protein